MAKKTKKSSFNLLILVAALILVGISYFYFKGNTLSESTPQVTQLRGTIIDDFPDFPIYPNANVQSSQRTEAYGTEPVSYQAYFESTDSVSKVIKWFKEKLTNSGWTIEDTSDTSQADEQNLVVTKGKMEATVFVENEEGESTFISIHIQ